MSGSLAFKPFAGVHVRNSQGEDVLWAHAKTSEDGTRSFVELLYRPDRVDRPEDFQRLKQAYELILSLASRLGWPVFDFNEVESELAKYSSEVDLRQLSSDREDSVDISVHDVLTGKLTTFTVGLRKSKRTK